MDRSIAASGQLYGAQWDDAANVYQSSIGLHAKKGHANVGPSSGSTRELRRKFVQEDDDGASKRQKQSKYESGGGKCQDNGKKDDLESMEDDEFGLDYSAADWYGVELPTHVGSSNVGGSLNVGAETSKEHKQHDDDYDDDFDWSAMSAGTLEEIDSYGAKAVGGKAPAGAKAVRAQASVCAKAKAIGAKAAGAKGCSAKDQAGGSSKGSKGSKSSKLANEVVDVGGDDSRASDQVGRGGMHRSQDATIGGDDSQVSAMEAPAGSLQAWLEPIIKRQSVPEASSSKLQPEPSKVKRAKSKSSDAGPSSSSSKLQPESSKPKEAKPPKSSDAGSFKIQSQQKSQKCNLQTKAHSYKFDELDVKQPQLPRVAGTDRRWDEFHENFERERAEQTSKAPPKPAAQTKSKSPQRNAESQKRKRAKAAEAYEQQLQKAVEVMSTLNLPRWIAEMQKKNQNEPVSSVVPYESLTQRVDLDDTPFGKIYTCDGCGGPTTLRGPVGPAFMPVPQFPGRSLMLCSGKKGSLSGGGVGKVQCAEVYKALFPDVPKFRMEAYPDIDKWAKQVTTKGGSNLEEIRQRRMQRTKDWHDKLDENEKNADSYRRRREIESWSAMDKERGRLYNHKRSTHQQSVVSVKKKLAVDSAAKIDDAGYVSSNANAKEGFNAKEYLANAKENKRRQAAEKDLFDF